MTQWVSEWQGHLLSCQVTAKKKSILQPTCSNFTWNFTATKWWPCIKTIHFQRTCSSYSSSAVLQLLKARGADCRQGVAEGAVAEQNWWVLARKMVWQPVNLEKWVRDCMCILLSTLAKSKVREGGVTRGTRGFWRTEEGERALSSFKFIGAPWNLGSEGG